MAETALDWAPPLSQAPAASDATPAPSARPLLDTPAGELALFRSLITHRLVGPNKHFDMVAVLLSLQRALASEEGGEEAARGLKSEDVWSKWRELYDQETLESVWEEQQEQLLPTPSASPAPDTAALTTEAAQPSPTPSQSLSDRVATLHFPRRPFDLSPEPSIQIAAFQRGLVPKGSKHESPVPDDAPLREVSVPLPDGETSGRGKRKKRAAAGGSPRKKQKVDKKPSGGEEEDSELSELSEDADEDADESAEEGGDGEEEAEEDVEEDDGTSVTGTAATVDDDSASTATEADAKRKPADKAAAIRSLPSSNRRSRASNARERQDSTPASSDAGISTPAKKGTRSTAKTVKKEEAAPASAPRSSRRRR
ncbi:hypothetical protein NBRC10512_007394 [Rhodotorula toruloides]|uniref:RHTO0S12e02850g1_1 n=2 Tax=Rhodotorula toruloides TaxID=5286 RepID=A0A061BEJ4_RHOTO|nr:protein of chromatin modification-related protein EAF7 family [Rhodotorula toruloides NP11]EMS23214.1 protein of chromatin modification-related protein EAF7 family [Rhodotorula toruloides NP11]CDR46316.1 RHTO0S12e02850g1_1 [Rhodotorula toruloides]